MNSLYRGFRGLGFSLLVLVSLSCIALAGPVTNVTTSKGPDWVKVNVNGSFNYTVKHLPQGSANYRSIAIDCAPAYIPGNMEPKAVLPVNFGLVGQVRVRQLSGGVVRVYVDVINYPEYTITRTGNGIQVNIKAFKQRSGNPEGQY